MAWQLVPWISFLLLIHPGLHVRQDYNQEILTPPPPTPEKKPILSWQKTKRGRWARQKPLDNNYLIPTKSHWKKCGAPPHQQIPVESLDFHSPLAVRRNSSPSPRWWHQKKLSGKTHPTPPRSNEALHPLLSGFSQPPSGNRVIHPITTMSKNHLSY